MPEPAYHHLKADTEQGTLVLTILEAKVQGDAVTEALRQEMLAALAASGARQVVVNFQNTHYVSSAAFRPLLGVRRRLQETGGGRIILCGLSPAVGDVFYTTRMIGDNGVIAPLFEVAPDVAAAVALMNEPMPPT